MQEYIQSILDNADLGAAYPIVIVISVVIGLASLLYGYRLFKLFLFLAGFIVSAIVARLFVALPGALLIGLIAGAICMFCWYLGVFLLGATFGTILGVILGSALGLDELALLAVPAILFGVLAIIIRKFMLILTTSWNGASVLAFVTGPMLGLQNFSISLTLMVLLTISGIVCQYTLTSGKEKTTEEASA